MPSFGEKLRVEREKRKITLEDISVSTKIGTRMLRALEENQFSQLPGGIFNKGFVRAYARALGLDEEQAVADYLQASGNVPVVQIDVASQPGTASGRKSSLRDRSDAKSHTTSTKTKNTQEPEETADLHASASRLEQQLPWGIFAALLLAVALALSLWSRFERSTARRESQTVTATSENPAPVSHPSNTTAEVPPASSATSGTNSRLRQSSGANQNSVTPQPGPPGKSSSASQSSNNQTSGSHISESGSHNSSLTSPPGAELSVVIQAREESWITITADGKTISSELLPAGGERTIHGHEQITVKAGNAGGIDLQFNGKRIGSLGQFGEVKTVTFGPRGLT